MNYRPGQVARSTKRRGRGDGDGTNARIPRRFCWTKNGDCPMGLRKSRLVFVRRKTEIRVREGPRSFVPS
jgi:hypothetical protein